MGETRSAMVADILDSFVGADAVSVGRTLAKTLDRDT